MPRKLRLLPSDPQIGWTPFAWLIYLVPFVLAPFVVEATLRHRAITVLGTAAFLVLYFAGYWQRGSRLLVIIGGIVAIGCAFLPVHPGAAVFFIYAAAFAAPVDGTTRTTVAVIALICAVLVVEALILDLPLMLWLWGLVFAVLIGALNLHSVQTMRMNAKLRLAQHEIEHLAQVAERERIARDLHDVLGHTLSLIVLKSELASKLAERDAARAADEIREVERIARDALAQVRTALTGYRTAGFDRELESARDVLTTAGLQVEISRGVAKFTPSEEAVLSLAVREAVTNVLRHARASRCVIRIDRDDDGTRAIHVIDNGLGIRAPHGLGLQGMNERVAAIGGTLSVTGEGGTHLSVVLPCPERAKRDERPPSAVERAS